MITRVLLSARIGELPKDFSATVEVDGYEIMIIIEERPSVTVSKKRSPGKGSHIVIYDPNPDIAVEEVYRKAREVLEALAKK